MALNPYEQAVTGKPEWENARLARALYWPRTAQSIEETGAERKRRRQKGMAAGAHS